MFKWERTHHTRELTAFLWVGLLRITGQLHLLEVHLERDEKKMFYTKVNADWKLAWRQLSTYRHGSISNGPLGDGSVASANDRPRLVQGLHADLLTVYQQLHFAVLHAQGQLVPVSVKQLLHASEGPEHLVPAWADVEEVQGAIVVLEAQTNLLLALQVADLPQVPGSLGCFFVCLKCRDDGVVARKPIWIDIAGGGTVRWVDFVICQSTFTVYCGIKIWNKMLVLLLQISKCHCKLCRVLVVVFF